MVDLHTHSNHSDGSDSVKELIINAKAQGLKAIALTDHNTIDGLDELVALGEEYNIEVIPAIEITTATGNEDFHIIGMFVTQEHYAPIQAYLKTAIDNKIASNKTLVKNLCNAGYNVSYDNIVKKFGNERFNRVAIANELKDKGYINEVYEGFAGLLNEKNGYYTPPKRLDTFETIAFLKSINVMPIWAHPLKDTTFDRLNKIHLQKAKDCGLAGMEIMHSSYDEQKVVQAKLLADKFNLLCSGGSDYHGTNKSNVLLGTGTNNNVRVEYKMLEKIKNAHNKKGS